MTVHQWKAKVFRWQQLTRYYVNKWQYDGSKWAERVWYGTGSQSADTVASVPFMITRNMRNELEKAGFPAFEISALLPKAAHQLINDKVSYAQFEQIRKAALEAADAQQQETQEEQQPVVDPHQEIKELVASIQAREQHDSDRVHVTNQIALVPETQAEESMRSPGDRL